MAILLALIGFPPLKKFTGMMRQKKKYFAKVNKCRIVSIKTHEVAFSFMY